MVIGLIILIISIICIMLVITLMLIDNRKTYKQGFDDGVRYALKQVPRVVDEKEREAHEKAD